MDNHLSPNFLDSASDELQRLAVEETLKRRLVERDVRALVYPAGKCDLPYEMAQHGVAVTAMDEANWKSSCQTRIKQAKLEELITFAPGGLSDLDTESPNQPFDVVVCRRGLSSVPYAEARAIIKKLMRKLRIGGKLYISLLGVHSELGDDYPGIEMRVNDRFFPLAPEIAKKYGIEGPLCLYGERDIFLLLLEAGASVLRTFTSTHGSVKAIAVRV